MVNKWKKLPSLERWKAKNPTSASLRIFRQYDVEIRRFMASFYASQKYTYSQLGKKGSLWTDKAKDCFSIGTIDENLTLGMWQSDYKKFNLWIRLNFLMSTCSFFETYIDSVITESIQSDPGIMLGCSRIIDGIRLMKYNNEFKKDEFEDKIIDCVKGDWNSRLSGLYHLFPDMPTCFKDNLSDLEHVRILRNEVAHAFGRDINESRNYELNQIQPMRPLSIKTCGHYHHIMFKIAREFDEYLMNNHIGNYEPLLYYHRLYSTIADKEKGDKLMTFKKSIGKDKIGRLISKSLCRQIIMYYDSL